MSESWKPIKTAPKDGTEVLVWCYGRADNFANKIWEKCRSPHIPDFDLEGEVKVAWYCKLTTNMADENGRCGWLADGRRIAPTHWKPLDQPTDKQIAMASYNESDHIVPENERGPDWFAGDGRDCRIATQCGLERMAA